MVSSIYRFVGDKNMYSYSISENVEENMKFWMDLSFLSMGAYTTIEKNEINYLGDRQDKLFAIKDAVYGDGYIYQSYYKNWVWENDVEIDSNYSYPIICSGIWIESDFHHKDLVSGVLEYHIDYKNGRIVFDNQDAVESSYGSGDLNIYAEFSYKNVYIVTKTELIKTISESLEMNNPIGSGEKLLSSDEIPLPCILVGESEHEWTGYQLGGGKICGHNIYAKVYANDESVANSVIDILSQQENKRIPSIDWSTCDSTFDEYGDINPSFSGVYEVYSIYDWGKEIYIENANGFKKESGPNYGFVEYLVKSSFHL